MRYGIAFRTLSLARRNPPDGTAASLIGGAFALLVATGVMSALGGFDLGAAVAAIGAYAVVCVMILAFVQKTHPHPSFGLPNQITLARAILNCLLVGLLFDLQRLQEVWSGGFGWLFLAVALASLALDGIDGRLARRLGLASPFGARFDIEIDALLLTLLAVTAVALGNAGPWVLLIAGMYYLFRLAGLALPWLRQDLPPAFWRKAVCVLQGAALLYLVFPAADPATAHRLAALSLVALTLSFARDVFWLWQRRAPR